MCVANLFLTKSAKAIYWRKDRAFRQPKAKNKRPKPHTF